MSELNKESLEFRPDVPVTGGGTAGDGLMGQLTRLLPGVDLSGVLKQGGATKAG